MRSVLKLYLRDVWRAIWKAIFLSLTITVFVWFFLNVVFRLTESTFVEIWRTSYLVILGFSVTADTLIYAGLARIVYTTAKRLSLSYQDSFEANIRYQLQDLQPRREWTREWVLKNLELERNALRFRTMMEAEVSEIFQSKDA